VVLFANRAKRLDHDLAARFNNTYSETFKIPDAYVPKTGARIMSLADPTRKMSKSDDNDRATLYILDEPDRILKKIGSAVTDSGSEVKAGPDKPGVSNLLAIHAGLSGETVPALEEKFTGQGYGAFKAEIGEVVVEALRPVREKYHELIKDKDYLRTVLRNGAEAAQRRANKIMRKVYRKVGFPDRTQ
jgi:tryptophanyl-tRNA synthetase